MNMSLNKSEIENNISKVLGFRVYNFKKLDNGIFFNVKTELNAYKAAYMYQTPQKKIEVGFNNDMDEWNVIITER